jgi:hypothetical protein
LRGGLSKAKAEKEGRSLNRSSVVCCGLVFFFEREREREKKTWKKVEKKLKTRVKDRKKSSQP